MISILDKNIITEIDIEQLISFKLEESVNLEFKHAEALENKDKNKAEIAKDVSAFANSAGGFIVYGIKEEVHVASTLSFIDGDICTKEWIEQVIQSRIQRKIEDLKIIPVRFNNEVKKSIYVIKIPESALAPHMTSDKRFYKRFNFESVQMEEYEIRNLYNRKEKTKLLINNVTKSADLKYENKNSDDEIVYYFLGFQVENIGKAIERHYKLLININFYDYIFKWDERSPSKPNHSIGNDNNRIISFSNTHPIFPEEILMIGNMDFGIPTSKLDQILEEGKFNLKLIYTNGMDEMEISLKEIIKPVDRQL